ncbi:VWA domain-containing protein [bacterium]|nr:VWA domain-containing protein [bacterium]
MLDFLNPWMLAGLAGLALPVIAHLLSRRKFDVVHWGAMQFLELSRTTRRRVRLEELLLLLLRMAMVGLIAIALARPWLSGSVASLFSTRPACDVVIVIDSSYSTDWAGDGRTPHLTARAWSRSLLDALAPGDAAGLVDSREAPQPVLESLTQDFRLIHTAAEELPAPTASGRLSESILKAFQLSSAGTNLSRHIVVVTDGQAQAWQGIDDHFQLQLDELHEQATVPPELWIVNTRAQHATPVNHSVDRLELSREVTVADFPIRIRTKIRNSGGKAVSTLLTHLEIDGQRLAEQSRSVRVHPGGEAQVEFEHRFRTPGCHRVTVAIDADNLTADDRSDAVVEVAAALPVLMIDGSPHPDPTRSETFFARLALSPPNNPAPWISVRVVSASEFRADSIGAAQVVVLANVASLTGTQTEALTTFVADGGGLAITLGDQIKPAWYNEFLFADGTGLLPASIVEFRKAPQTPEQNEPPPPVTIDSDSLRLPWTSRFQAGSDDGFLSARFTNWYQLQEVEKRRKLSGPDLASDERPDGSRRSTAKDNSTNRTNPPDAVVAATLSTGDSLIVQRKFGRGEVAVFASTLDADWSTLPAKPDYVEFLHELIFRLASSRSPRNLDVGTPIVMPIPRGESAADWLALSPRSEELDIVTAGNELQPLLRIDAVSTPGVYRLRHRGAAADQRANAATSSDELFVANANRDESDLTPLTDERWTELTAEGRFRLIEAPSDLFGAVREESARVEIWFGLLLIFVLFLIGEVLLTRRLVQGGHSYGPDAVV